MKVLLAIGAFAMASSAVAQTQTDCTRDYFGNVHCQTRGSGSGINWGLLNQQPNVADSVQREFEEGQRQRALIEQQRAAAEQRRAYELQVQQTETSQSLRVQAGQLVAAGNCAGAEKLALDSGDISLAKSVKDYCSR